MNKEEVKAWNIIRLAMAAAISVVMALATDTSTGVIVYFLLLVKFELEDIKEAKQRKSPYA